MGRTPCCDKGAVKKGPWSPEEDSLLREYIERSGTGGNWISLPSKAGLNRCGKSCRLRWVNYLRPDIKRGSFTPEEEKIIYELHASIGTRWSVIAAQLPGRTDNDIKNHWNTKLKKRLVAKAQLEAPSSKPARVKHELDARAAPTEKPSSSSSHSSSESPSSATAGLLVPKTEAEEDCCSNRLRQIIDGGQLDILAKNLATVDESFFDPSWWTSLISPKINHTNDSLCAKQASLPALTSPGSGFELKIVDSWEPLPSSF